MTKLIVNSRKGMRFVSACLAKVAWLLTLSIYSRIVNCRLNRSILGSMLHKYLAQIPQISNVEVWFQRPKDIVRKLLSGDLDLGIVGLDTVSEYGQIPRYGIFENINSLKELAQMPQWTVEKPLRVVTGFIYLGPKFMKENGLKHVIFSTADGALEAAPAMGIADAILDLVSSGTTLKENNLKVIDGGVVLESQAVLVASRKALIQRKGALDTTHEILERFEAHLRALGQFTVRIFIIPILWFSFSFLPCTLPVYVFLMAGNCEYEGQ
ncbi:hypothetical protein CRYUN_Cryun06bG0010600 [Craigia yunnanensis]